MNKNFLWLKLSFILLSINSEILGKSNCPKKLSTLIVKKKLNTQNIILNNSLSSRSSGSQIFGNFSLENRLAIIRSTLMFTTNGIVLNSGCGIQAKSGLIFNELSVLTPTLTIEVSFNVSFTNIFANLPTIILTPQAFNGAVTREITGPLSSKISGALIADVNASRVTAQGFQISIVFDVVKATPGAIIDLQTMLDLLESMGFSVDILVQGPIE